MIHIAILIIAAIVVGGGIFVRNKANTQTQQGDPVALGLTDLSQTQTPTMTAPLLTPTPVASTNTPSPSTAPSSQQSPSTHLTDFIYPGATIGIQTQERVTVTSGDDPQKITDWYKQKIKDLAMNTRSFVQTKTNDNVHNVLAAAKNDDEIKITITKNAGDSVVSVTVER